MSLFDLIRYPVTDIYNSDELNALPEDLYRRWITVCHNSEDIEPSTERYTQVRALVILKVLECTREVALHRQQGWEDMWKAKYTILLKETIKNHDIN